MRKRCGGHIVRWGPCRDLQATLRALFIPFAIKKKKKPMKPMFQAEHDPQKDPFWLW